MELIPYLVTRVIDFNMRILFSAYDYKVYEEKTPTSTIWKIVLFNGDCAKIELLPKHVIAVACYSERIWEECSVDFLTCIQAIAKQLDLLSTVEHSLVPLKDCVLADFCNLGIDYTDHRDEITYRYGMYAITRFRENKTPETFDITFDDVIEILKMVDTDPTATFDFDTTCKLIQYADYGMYERNEE